MSKYGNKKKIIDGYLFDSTKEADRYSELKLEEKAGLISDLVPHPTYLLQEKFEAKNTNIPQKKIRRITYTPDFQYYDISEKIMCVEDVKPSSRKFSVESYMIKRKLFLKKYPDLFFQEIR